MALEYCSENVRDGSGCIGVFCNKNQVIGTSKYYHYSKKTRYLKWF